MFTTLILPIYYVHLSLPFVMHLVFTIRFEKLFYLNVEMNFCLPQQTV